MQSRVGLLTRNIVIKGDGQGEDRSYHSWNIQTASSSAVTCGNRQCEIGENSITCGADCVGPIYEFGVSILVSAYNDDYVYCDSSMQCQLYSRTLSGRMELDNIELRYFGQNSVRAGVELIDLLDVAAVNITSVAFNRGYFRAVDIQNTVGAVINGNLIFRSHLPSLRIQGGRDNIISNNLAIGT